MCGCVGVLPDIGMGEYSRELGVWVCSLCGEESSGKKVRNLLLRIQQDMEHILNSRDSSVQVRVTRHINVLIYCD